MKIVDRLILALYSLSIGLISLIIMILPFNMSRIFNIRDGIAFLQSMGGNYYYTLISLIFFTVSIRFLLSGIIGTRDKKDESFLVMRNEYGEIVIYSHTIVGIVQSIAGEFTGIRNISTRVNLVNGEIEVFMKGEVLPEINIPEITKDLQRKVKKSLEDTTGAMVGEIKVEINNVSAPDRMVK